MVKKKETTVLKCIIFTFELPGKHKSIKRDHVRIDPTKIDTFLIDKDLKKGTFKINIEGKVKGFNVLEKI